MQVNPSVRVDVVCYNTDNAKPVEEYNGFTIYRVPCWQPLRGQFAIPNYFALATTLQKLFAKNRYSFVNSHTRFFESSWWVPFVAKYYYTRSVLTDHCATHPTHARKVISYIAQAIDKTLVPFFMKKYDFVTVTNKATLSFVESLGVQNAHLIYGGVDIKEFNQSKKALSRRIPGIKKTFSSQDIIITFVGRMIESKGPHLLLEAVQDIIKKNDHVFIVFAGDGPLFASLSQHANDRIFFTGSLEKKQVAHLLKQTDILVHPSLHHEGFPNVILEAGASHCAVIATDKGGTREIIHQNKTGLIINPTVTEIQKALKILIKDSDKRQRLAKDLRSWIVANYSWNTIAKDFQELISATITKPSTFPAIGMISVPLQK
jgi:glycosyltransferase involved in cell wall biosynthesis